MSNFEYVLFTDVLFTDDGCIEIHLSLIMELQHYSTTDKMD